MKTGTIIRTFITWVLLPIFICMGSYCLLQSMDKTSKDNNLILSVKVRCADCDNNVNSYECKKCGSDNIVCVSDTYCTKCEKHIRTEKNTRFCEYCGTELGFKISVKDTNMSIKDIKSKSVLATVIMTVFILSCIYNIVLIISFIIEVGSKIHSKVIKIADKSLEPYLK